MYTCTTAVHPLVIPRCSAADIQVVLPQAGGDARSFSLAKKTLLARWQLVANPFRDDASDRPAPLRPYHKRSVSNAQPRELVDEVRVAHAYGNKTRRKAVVRGPTGAVRLALCLLELSLCTSLAPRGHQTTDKQAGVERTSLACLYLFFYSIQPLTLFK